MKDSGYKRVKQIIHTRNKLLYAAAVLFALVTAMFQILLAFVLMELIDSNVSGGMDEVMNVILFSICFAFTYVFCNIISSYVVATYTKRAVYNLRSALMGELLHKSLSEMKNKDSGAYISILNNDISTVEMNHISAKILIFKNIILIIMGISAMFYTHVGLTVIVLVTCTLPVIVSLFFSGRLKKHQSGITSLNQELTATIKDVLTGFSVIKSFNIGRIMGKMVDSKSLALEDSKQKFQFVSGVQESFLTLSSITILLSIFSFGTIFTINGSMTTGMIIAFVQLLNNITDPISRLSLLISKEKATQSIFAVFMEILSGTADTGHQMKLERLKRHIVFENVSYSSADGVTILKNVSHSFAIGARYAIVGLSGSGKTSLLNLMAGYHTNYTGSIKLDGLEIRDVREQDLCGSISLVQQESFVFNDTILNNISLFQDYPEDMIEKAVRNAELSELIKERGKDMLCGENGHNLSGGEKQRISLARAFLRKPALLLLDEATSALDAETSMKIENRLAESKELTLISITHKVDPVILKEYDKIIMMKSGELCECGSYQELMERKGAFYKLIEVRDLTE